MPTFDKLLVDLDEHSEAMIDRLIQLMEQKYVSLRDFNALAKELANTNYSEVF